MRLTMIILLLLLFIPSVMAGTWSDGFEHPQVEEWKVHFPSGNQPLWEIERGSLLADQSGVSGMWLGDNTWDNYSVEVTITLLEDRPCGPGTPNSHAAAIFTYGKIAPFQNHYYGVGLRLFDGKGPGFYAGAHNGWGPPIVTKHKAQKIHFGIEYNLRITEEEKNIKCYFDDELILEFKRKYTAGIVGLYIFNMRAYFDDFVVTGDNIPDGGPGLGKAMKRKDRLATTWAYIKNLGTFKNSGEPSL